MSGITPRSFLDFAISAVETVQKTAVTDYVVPGVGYNIGLAIEAVLVILAATVMFYVLQAVEEGLQ